MLRWCRNHTPDGATRHQSVGCILGSALVLALTMTDAAETPAQRFAHTVQAMQGETLLDTSPPSLGAAAYLLAESFERGVKDIDRYVYFAKLILQHTLNLAERDPEQAAAYRAAAVPMTYNLAANTWIGWGAGVGAIKDRHQRLGLEAARLNVELAQEIGLGPERRRNGYWILGAHRIAAGDLAGARSAFETSAALATEAGLATGALMATGWIHVVDILDGRDAAAALAAVEAQLRKETNGNFLADQYGTALDVFGSQAAPRPEESVP